MRRLADPHNIAPQPRARNPCQVSHAHGLATIRFRSPLLTESLLFSLPTGTEMFHFPAFPPHRLSIHRRVTAHNHGRVSPFGHPRINARLATPRGITQPPTSFIGSSVPRHPPCALNNNTHNQLDEQKAQHTTTQHGSMQNKEDTRVHYAVLKHHTHHHQRRTQSHTTSSMPVIQGHDAPDTQHRDKPSTPTPGTTTRHKHHNQRSSPHTAWGSHPAIRASTRIQQ